jgi:hypothetical protein
MAEEATYSADFSLVSFKVLFSEGRHHHRDLLSGLDVDAAR